MSRDHRFADRAALTLEELASEKFVMRKRSTALSIEVTAACHRAGFTPRVAQHAPQLSAMVNLVSASMGIAIVPECMREVRKDRVVFIPISGLDIRARLALLRRDHNLPAAQHLIEEALALRR
jgi:DNA-binding transcriptional LysR family regulator